MTDVELEKGGATLEQEGEDGIKADLETEEPPSCSETAGARAKDHCDYLLDSIDAQLSQLQWQDSGTGIADASMNGHTSQECSPNASQAAELEGCCANPSGTSWGRAGPARMEEYSWRLMHLLGSEQAPENLEDQSDSNSICTEDFAARFREGMVDPLVISDGEGGMHAVAFPAEDSATGIKAGPAGLLPLVEACGAAAEGFPLSTARRQEDILQWFKQEPEGNFYVALSISVEGPRSLNSTTRRESLESLGGRISRLSQSNTVDTPSSADTGKASSTRSQAPGPAPAEGRQLPKESISCPLQQGGKRLEGSSRCGQDSQENPVSFNSPLLAEELGPSQPFRALGAHTHGTRAWDGECQPTGTARSPSGRRQTEYEPTWCESPPHPTPAVAHSSPSLASQGEKSPCPGQGLPPEWKKPGEPGSAVQGFGATAQLVGSPESVAGGGRVVMQGGGWELSSQTRVGPGEPKREAPELVLESVVPLGPAGRGVARAAESGGREETGRSCEPEPRPVERAACGLTRPPGCSPKGSCHPRRDSLRGLGSSSAVTDEEEEEDEFLRSHGSIDWRSRSPVRWSPVPSGAESRNEACMEQQDPGAEVERLLQRKSWLRKADLSPSNVLGPRKVLSRQPGVSNPIQQSLPANQLRARSHQSQLATSLFTGSSCPEMVAAARARQGTSREGAAQELEWLRGALQRSQEEAEMLDSHVKEAWSKADEARADLLLLEYRWDSCLRELPALEKELSALRRQRSTTHSSQLGAFQAEVSSLAAEREKLKARVRHLDCSLSFLERRELERQLSCCTAELFSVQQAARARIEELQELQCLEEAQNELEERAVEGTVWQEETTQLRLQLRELERKQTAALSGQIRDLQARETEQELKLSALETLLSEKELELARVREAVCALTAEKEAQQRAMENLRDEHSWQLEKIQQDKELQLAQQREELQRRKQQELQEFADSLEQVKARALQDQAASFQKKVENLTRVIKARDEEVLRQWEALQLHKESTQQLARELKLDATETIIWELELHGRSLQREKQEALEERRVLLQEEKTEALKRLREELEQERARESDRLKARLQQLEEEQSLLQTEQNEMSSRERAAQSHAEQAERSLAKEIGLACQRLQDLLPRGLMAHGSPAPLSTSRALQLLHGVSEETQRYLGALQQEVEAQKRTVLRLQEEKAWELRQQREQLHMESKEALEALKERLIQEQLQEIGSLQRRQLTGARGGQQQRLRQQLREKGSELQAIQSSVARWKGQTARKFEEELNAELEMRFSKDPPVGLRGCAERLDAEIGRLATDRGEHPHLCPTSSPSRSATPARGQHNFVSWKLLSQLEGRVRELRVENAIYRGGSLEDLAALWAEPGQTGREKFHGATHRK